MTSPDVASRILTPLCSSLARACVRSQHLYDIPYVTILVSISPQFLIGVWEDGGAGWSMLHSSVDILHIKGVKEGVGGRRSQGNE